jgi:phosphotransferase system enzyme I (PtsI)
LLIRTLAQIATDGKAAQIEVGVCGESAGDPVFAVVLAGLGVSSVSVSPSQVDLVRAALSSVDANQAKKIAKAALAATSAEAAEAAALEQLPTA